MALDLFILSHGRAGAWPGARLRQYPGRMFVESEQICGGLSDGLTVLPERQKSTRITSCGALFRRSLAGKTPSSFILNPNPVIPAWGA